MFFYNQFLLSFGDVIIVERRSLNFGKQCIYFFFINHIVFPLTQFIPHISTVGYVIDKLVEKIYEYQIQMMVQDDDAVAIKDNTKAFSIEIMDCA